MYRGWALGGLVLGLSAGALPMIAHAQQVTEIFKCRSESGQVTYTNDRRQAEKQKCELVTSQVNVAPSKGQQARPPSFPRESSRDSQSARDRQREILERELASERTALDQARQALAQQEAMRSGDERNYARVQERLQPFKATVENHEKNIQALQRELGNLK